MRGVRNTIFEFWIFLRSVYFWILCVIVTAVICLLASLTLPFRAYNLVTHLARLWGRIMIMLSPVTFIVENKEKLYTGGPVILISNHQSMFDVVTMFTFIRMHVRWMAKDSLFYIPVFGWAMKAAGFIPVVRNDKKKAIKALYEAAEDIRNGVSVILFPEGTRGFEDGSMRPFKGGGFILARKARVPLQPVVVYGAHKIIPVKRNQKFQKIYPGIVNVAILDPILPEEYGHMKADELSDFVRKKMEVKLGEFMGGKIDR